MSTSFGWAYLLSSLFYKITSCTFKKIVHSLLDEHKLNQTGYTKTNILPEIKLLLFTGHVTCILLTWDPMGSYRYT